MSLKCECELEPHKNYSRNSMPICHHIPFNKQMCVLRLRLKVFESLHAVTVANIYGTYLLSTEIPQCSD